jgi:hypothetical protein
MLNWLSRLFGARKPVHVPDAGEEIGAIVSMLAMQTGRAVVGTLRDDGVLVLEIDLSAPDTATDEDR